MNPLALQCVFGDAAQWELEAAFLWRLLMNTMTKWLLVKRQLQRAWHWTKLHVLQSLGNHYETSFSFITQYDTITSNLTLTKSLKPHKSSVHQYFSERFTSVRTYFTTSVFTVITCIINFN